MRCLRQISGLIKIGSKRLSLCLNTCSAKAFFLLFVAYFSVGPAVGWAQETKHNPLVGAIDFCKFYVGNDFNYSRRHLIKGDYFVPPKGLTPLSTNERAAAVNFFSLPSILAFAGHATHIDLMLAARYQNLDPGIAREFAERNFDHAISKSRSGLAAMISGGDGSSEAWGLELFHLPGENAVKIITGTARIGVEACVFSLDGSNDQASLFLPLGNLNWRQSNGLQFVQEKISISWRHRLTVTLIKIDEEFVWPRPRPALVAFISKG